MLKKSLKLFSFTCIFGIFGAFIRWLQSLTAFEPETGLAIAGARWSVILVIYCVIVTAALAYLISRLKSLDFPAEYSQAFSTPSPVFDIVSVVLAVLMGLGGILTIFPALTPPYSFFELATGLFAIVAAVCLIVFLRSTKLDHAQSRGSAASLIIDLFMCFWLIASYKTFASDPIIWHYAPRLLAICACVLAFYYVAGFPYRKPRPLLTLFFSNLSAFLFIVTLADGFAIGKQLMAVSCAATLCIYSILLVSNAKEAGE